MTQIRTLMLLGALTGFAIGIGFGLARQGDSKWIFLKACVAAYLAALLMRWWGRIWIRSIREMHQEQSELEKATQDEAPTTESNS
jgi:hypothetical protein